MSSLICTSKQTLCQRSAGVWPINHSHDCFLLSWCWWCWACWISPCSDADVQVKGQGRHNWNTLICQLQNPAYPRGNGSTYSTTTEKKKCLILMKKELKRHEYIWCEPRLAFLKPGLASSLSPAIWTRLITPFCKNKPFSKYRVSASVNELSVDHLQLLLSAGSPIHANSLPLLSIILPALTRASAVARSAHFSATSLSFGLVLRQRRDFLETTPESVNGAQNK